MSKMVRFMDVAGLRSALLEDFHHTHACHATLCNVALKIFVRVDARPQKICAYLNAIKAMRLVQARMKLLQAFVSEGTSRRH
jgi:hypothetical protein